jgi:hypothetical protein
MEKIQLQTDKRVRRWMPKNHYQKVYDFIMSIVTSRKEISLIDLVDEASKKISTLLPPNYTWILLQVKLDMELRGIIETNIRNGMMISLKRVPSMEQPVI